MKVYVVMGNDFPECVYASREGAEAFIERIKAQPGANARIHWRVYEFTLTH